jgi:hypothetical protein
MVLTNSLFHRNICEYTAEQRGPRDLALCLHVKTQQDRTEGVLAQDQVPSLPWKETLSGLRTSCTSGTLLINFAAPGGEGRVGNTNFLYMTKVRVFFTSKSHRWTASAPPTNG